MINKESILFKIFLIFVGIILIFPIGRSQVNDSTFRYHYETVKMDSTFDNPVDLTMDTYIETNRSKMGKELEIVIGESASELPRYKPQSPLSNFLVDQLFIYASQYLQINNSNDSIDIALLNLGGIRASMNAGKIKVENIYQIAPFDNYFVLVYIKGSELKKMYKKFTEKDMGILANSQMVFQNGRIISYSIQGKPIQDDKTYVMATIDFLSNGGDGYLENIKVEKVDYTGILIRDIYIQQIQKITASGKKVESKMDQRVIIKPTP